MKLDKDKKLSGFYVRMTRSEIDILNEMASKENVSKSAILRSILANFSEKKAKIERKSCERKYLIGRGRGDM